MLERADTALATAPQTPSFDLGSFLSGAFKLGCEVDYMTSFPSLPTNSQKMTSPASSESRKRRRGEVANPANTLDGLVAKRADDGREPFQKRYLSEQEAIEGPDDEIEMKKMEKDPDVSTRTCSTCGYQGKWVSEMIRHKRVHTSERPFKCRYCSRTSKWKADLIRHVAKTHGIRVVSKYSRSKSFDPTSALLTRSEDDKPKIFACDPEREPDVQRQDSPVPSEVSTIHRPEPVTPKSPLSYRCVRCLFEHDGLSVMVSHLRNVHDVKPYECRCGASFEQIDRAFGHHSSDGCSSNDLIVNITPVYNRVKAPSVTSMESLSPVGSRGNSSPESSQNMDEEELDKSCTVCPFESQSEDSMKEHQQHHDAPQGLFSFKCAFCPWFSTKKSAIETHMRLHTPYPQQFMASVEKNIINPMNTNIINTRMDLPALSPTSPLDISSALLALQSRINPAYLASMTCLLSTLSPSAFSPVTTLATFNCTSCEARFREQSQLKSHLKFHGSQRDHACSFCDYSANKSSNLMIHMQTHHHGSQLLISQSIPEETEDCDDVVDVVHC